MILSIISIIVSALLIGVILMQVSGSGLSSSFGGGGGGGDEFRSRRSMEKVLVYITVTLAVLFALISILLLILR